MYDAAVIPCAQQLGALAGIIDKAAAHCATNKIEESVLLQDRLYPDMFCLARQIRQSADFAMNTGGRLAGVTPPALPAVDDTSFAAAKSRVETALGFVKSLTRAQVDGAEGKVIAWTGGGNDRKMKAINQSAAWTAGANAVVLRTTNGGLNWSSVGGGRIGTATVYNIDALNDSVAFVTTTPGTSTYIFRTTNRGLSWDTVYTLAGGFIDGIRMYNANNGFAIGDPVDTLWTVLRTTDGGASWFRIATQPPQVGGEAGTQNGMTIYVPPVGQVQIWFTSGVGGRVYHSADAGATWSSGSAPFAATSNVWFNGSQNGFVTGSTPDSLARTTDGGATWSSVPVSGSGFLIACSGSGANDFWYARGNTIYRSTDRGASFAAAYTGTGTYVGLSFATSGTGTFGWAVTSTGGIAAFNGTITSVPGEQQPPVGLPENITLMQNYPNPFNPSTTIAFAVPTSSLVTIRVYDILGREVRTLLKGVQNGGHSQVTWDGTNNSGARAASGIYYCRLETSLPNGTTRTSSRKMLLLK